MSFPTFDEWQKDKRPWKTDEEFDAKRAEGLVYSLEKQVAENKARIKTLREEKSTLQDEVDDLTDAAENTPATKAAKDGDQPDPTDIAAIVAAELAKIGVTKKSSKEKRKEAEAAERDSDLKAARLEIALEKGLTKAQAARLVGDTREELESDADAYIEEHGLGTGDGGEEHDKDRQDNAPPSQRTQVRTGTRRGEAPDPLEGMDPGAMYDKMIGANG